MFDNASEEAVVVAAMLTAGADEDEDCDHRIPRDLDGWEPGLFSAAVLSSLDRSRLSGYDLVKVMKARARLCSSLAAELLADMAEVARRSEAHWGAGEDSAQYLSAEIGAALHLTRRAADRELGFALDLRTRLPRVWEALHRGDIDVPRARTIVHATGHLPSQTAQTVVDRVLSDAAVLTTGELHARLRQLCIDANPDDAAKRLRAGTEERRIIAEENPDGTGNLLGLQLPPEQVAAARRRINSLARRAKTNHDPRTMDQIRADVFIDLLTGQTHHQTPAAAATVHIHVPLDTLTGTSEAPGDIAGWGPVIAEIARKVVADQHHTRWQYTVTDNGHPIATGTLRRRPTTTQQRIVRALHPRCVFPGCRMPAIDCDLDHTNPWNRGGPTTISNLGPLCRHHHNLKHRTPWHYTQTNPGTHQWTSPLGHTYTTTARGP